MLRRDMLRGLLALSGVTAVAALSSCSSTVVDTALVHTYDAKHQALLRRLVDLIIPDTESPGAIAAGVPEKMERVLLQWMGEPERKEWIEGFTALATELDVNAFLALNPNDQAAVLRQWDIAAFGADHQRYAFYRKFKREVATAYYRTEAGASEELKYLATPGDWKPCVPYSDIGKAWAV